MVSYWWRVPHICITRLSVLERVNTSYRLYVAYCETVLQLCTTERQYFSCVLQRGSTSAVYYKEAGDSNWDVDGRGRRAKAYFFPPGISFRGRLLMGGGVREWGVIFHKFVHNCICNTKLLDVILSCWT